MARPQIMQKLEHDKLLTKGNFPMFVDTWNYIANKIENIKGDWDTLPQNGHIKFDTTDPEHPVIRYVGGGNGTVLVDTEESSNPKAKSIEFNTEANDDYLQLYEYPKDRRVAPDDIYEDRVDVLIRDRVLGSNGNPDEINLNYIGLDYLINPWTDTKYDNGYYSLNHFVGCEMRSEVWQLYQFNDLYYYKGRQGGTSLLTPTIT